MTRSVVAERALGATLAGVTSATAYAVSQGLPSRTRSRWARINHAGRSVTLLEGPAHVVGLVAATSFAGPGPALAAAGSGLLGALDDLAGDTASKGLRGHLRAAREGRVTTGLVKIVGLGVVGLATAALQERRATASSRRWTGGPTRSREPRRPHAVDLVDVALGGAVIAGTANLLNLFDLRPGRALKVGILTGAPLALSADPHRAFLGAVAVGASIGVLGPDLRGESMLGDTGANALGAVLGSALVEGRSRRGRLALLAALTVTTLASEKVSFTRVIESTPGLRELDAWGRPRP